jgi:hypothetical protein
VTQPEPLAHGVRVAADQHLGLGVFAPDGRMRRLRASRIDRSATRRRYFKLSKVAFRAAWNASTASAKGCWGSQSGRTIIKDGFRRV